MSSSSTFRVKVSDQVKNTLAQLAKDDRTACRRLALILLSLEKNPTPSESRKLGIEGGPFAEERIWPYGAWRILYGVDRKRRAVEVGFVLSGSVTTGDK